MVWDGLSCFLVEGGYVREYGILGFQDTWSLQCVGVVSFCWDCGVVVLVCHGSD